MHRLTEITLDNPKMAGAVLLLITVVLGAGVPRIPIEHGYRPLIGESHPAIQSQDAMVERFSGGVPLEIAWECGASLPCESALDHASLTMADDVTTRLVALDNVSKVYSPTNTTLLLPDDSGFSIRRLVEHGEVVEDLDQLVAIAKDDDLWTGRLVSEDLRVGVIIVQPVSSSSDEASALIDSLDQLFDPHRAKGFDFRLNGITVWDVISGRELIESTNRIIPALVLVIAIVIFALGSSVTQVVVSLGTMGVALAWTQGVMGWVGWPQDGIHQVLAPLIMIVGVCDAVHLLSKTAEQTGDIGERVKRAAAIVAPACTVTTATTAVALASFMTSNLFSFVRFGAITALGVVVCLLLTFSLLPLLATTMPGFVSTSRSSGERWERFLSRIIEMSARRAVEITAASLLALAVGGYGWIALLKVDTDWVKVFGESSAITGWVEFFAKARGSSDSLEIQLDLPGDQTFDDAVTLSVVAHLANQLESFEEFGRSFSVINIIGRVNTALGGSTAPNGPYAPTQEGNAEILELIGFDDADSLSPWLTLDRKSTRLSLEGQLTEQAIERDLIASVQSAVGSIVPPDWKVTLAGNIATRNVWVPEVQLTQMRSFPTAFLLVFLLSAWFLRSFRLGLAAMLPTLVPIAVTLGTMGWLGMGLDIGRAMIAAVVIGIGVDDAIHFLDAYRRRRDGGSSSKEAAQLAIRDVGRALVTTSIALAAGFLTLMASAWQTISSFGFFVSLTVLAALAATLFLLPALLLGPWNRSADDVSRAA